MHHADVFNIRALKTSDTVIRAAVKQARKDKGFRPWHLKYLLDGLRRPRPDEV